MRFSFKDYLTGKDKKATEKIKVSEESSDQTTFTSRDELERVFDSRIAKMYIGIGGEHNSTRVCAAILDTGRFIVLSTPEYAKSDVAEEVKKACQTKNPGKDKVEVYVVAPVLLLSLQNKHTGTDRISSDREDSVYTEAFNEIITWGVQNDASDITLNVNKSEPKSQIKFHVGGLYIAPPRWQIETARLEEILNVAWQSSQGGVGAVLNHKKETQCRIETSVDGQRIVGRWAGMGADDGLSVTIRLQRVGNKARIRTLEELDYLPSHIEAFDRAQRSEGGAIIFSGVVGSGKTEGIASLLARLGFARKIVTMEDPVELVLRNAIQNTVSRSLHGGDEGAFKAKELTMKRSAAHDVLLGEIRDRETGLTFQDITSSGTNLYTTTHAPSPEQVPERLYSNTIGIPADFLASPNIIKLIVHQALVPKVCPCCALPISALVELGGLDHLGRKQSGKYWEEYIARIERLFQIDTATLKVRNLEGCSKCKNPDVPQLSGYLGRSPIVGMIEPAIHRGMLKHIRTKDTLGLQLYLDRLPRSPIDDADMTNKTMLECAMYKATLGMFDPRDIEVKTMAFETIEFMRKSEVVE